MLHHTARVTWSRRNEDFLRRKYSRAHTWAFDGGAEILASSSPYVVPAPLSDPRGVDPEEAFVAAVSSCHMLWFLSLAAGAGFVVDSYADDAVGIMQKTADGTEWIGRIELNPVTAFAGDREPSLDDLRRLHDEAHHKCYIANSVKSQVVIHLGA
jgi:organic hydroperoxide reductase OsmC/OhrA